MNRVKKVTKLDSKTKLDSRLSRHDKSPLQKVNSKKSLGKKNSPNAVGAKQHQSNLVDVSRVAVNTDSEHRLYAPEFSLK